MSRIGKLPIPILDKATVTIDGQSVSVKGPKGELVKSFDDSITIEQVENTIVVQPNGQSRHARAMFGTVRSIINSMVVGVVDGFSKQLIIKGVGFRATLQGDQLDLALGYSHPVVVTVPAGIQVTVADGTKISISGADKQVVGELAATIYSYFPAEPYKGKGVQIVGQYVRRKEGKKSA